jgi:hypothetical protein
MTFALVVPVAKYEQAENRFFNALFVILHLMKETLEESHNKAANFKYLF